jgi:hypothetical protein
MFIRQRTRARTKALAKHKKLVRDGHNTKAGKHFLKIATQRLKEAEQPNLNPAQKKAKLLNAATQFERAGQIYKNAYNTNKRNSAFNTAAQAGKRALQIIIELPEFTEDMQHGGTKVNDLLRRVQTNFSEADNAKANQMSSTFLEINESKNMVGTKRGYAPEIHIDNTRRKLRELLRRL